MMLSFRSGGLYSGVSLRIVLLILAFLAGAASGLFLAEIALSCNLSALGADTLELPALRAHAFWPACFLAAALLCAGFRILRHAFFTACFLYSASCVYCAARFWSAWGTLGLRLSCWLLLPRLLLLGCVGVRLLFSASGALRRVSVLLMLVPLLFLIQYLLYPVFAAPLLQMI